MSILHENVLKYIQKYKIQKHINYISVQGMLIKLADGRKLEGTVTCKTESRFKHTHMYVNTESFHFIRLLKTKLAN